MHGKRLRLVPVVAVSTVALGAALAGCGGGDSGGAGASSSAPARQSVAAPDPAAGCTSAPPELPGHAVTVDVPQAKAVLDTPGAGAGRALTIRPTAVAQYSLFTNSLQVSQVAGEQPTGGNRDVTLPFTAQPTCADPLNVYLFFDAPRSTDTATTKALEVEAGSVARVRMAPSGEVRSFTLAAPPEVSSEAQSAFEQALLQTFLRLVPLPAEPVAPGATWTVTRAIRADSTLTQTMQVTLAGTVERPELKAKVDESPDDSVFRVPGSDSTLTIESYTSEGNGTVEIDPARAFGQGGVQLEGGRTLVGDDPAKKLTQKTGSVYRFGPR
ncbi:hypothetical protein AXK56_14980 [Tsukamurella pulmonis]|uniref:Lipoprotein n=1 Tax=Tsukamurella pulmonis TaxID=47312 RepID=A0A1H1FWN4_9ACTN|nr:hypothetical protein [Tsukamurella pulmonis]KXO87712.1 hypothetical protein AXK56_14980 [Tsukamurella pulmonis]SDR05098.1 hypothetical protein SAMN04489765_2950 [Tsukamurella pulmonis]SUP18326.1 Uncharacterised protein [Tsukamurella pulmonis]